jgi:uncharacterized protein (DUF885 family)
MIARAPVAAVLLLLSCSSAPPVPDKEQAKGEDAANVEVRRKQLDALIAEQWEYVMRMAPEFASILGDKRYNDRWTDGSEKAVYANLEETKKFRARFAAIDTAGLPEQEVLNEALMLRQLDRTLEGARFTPWLMPVTQFFGPHINIPQLVSLLPFDSVKDYDDYITRLNTMPRVFDDAIDLMRKGMSEKLMPPRFLLEKAAGQAEKVAAGKAEDSPFAQPLRKLPTNISAGDQARLRAAILQSITEKVNPAYRKFAAFVKNEYAPAGRSDPGIWSLPQGAERYAFLVKQSTTTDMTPDQIHQLGLSEVARIEGEMMAIAKKLGYANLKTFNAAIEKKADLRPSSRQEMIDLYRKYTDQMYVELPRLFGRLPRAKVEIMPVEEFREKEASGAQYNQGTPDGSRPGHVMVNTGSFKERKTINIETTAYHEGVPGHHMQISIAQELPELPPFRQQYFVVAYVEGWALYAERLGEEVGFYQDDYSRYGHLQDEMLRAIRLVVDTGLHEKRWTRQQVVDFFHEHSNQDETEVQSETDRYIAIPGQALGYKIGQLKLLALRAKAQKALGSAFDIRSFHDEVLGAGALPLDVLEKQVDDWIARQKRS